MNEDRPDQPESPRPEEPSGERPSPREPRLPPSLGPESTKPAPAGGPESTGGPDSAGRPGGPKPPDPPGGAPPRPDLTPPGGRLAPVPTIRGDRSFLLREMGLGELLDASIKLYRQHWKPLMAVIAFVIVPYTFLQSYATRPPDGFVDQSTVDRALVFAVVFGAASFLFVQPFLAGAIARAAYSVYLGERIDVGVVYRVALSLLLPILWVSFLAALGVAVGFLLLVIPGIIAAIRFAFATQVVVVEGARGVGALRRSWRLAKGSFWRILGTLLLAGILASVVTSILTIPTALITSRMDPSAWPIRAVGASIAAVITTPFTALVRVLLYFDMRIRKEAFDLAVMAQEMAGRGEGG